MSNKLRLPNINLEQATKVAGKYVSVTVDFCKAYKGKILISGLITGLGIDDISQRIGRNKERKEYENSAIKSQKIMRKHEAEIQMANAENIDLVENNDKLCALNSQLVKVIKVTNEEVS